MKYFIPFIFLFFTNCLVPTAVLATVNVENYVTHSHITPPKKLTYRERVVLNYRKYQARFKATFKEKLKKSLGWWIIGAISFTFGLWLITSANRRNSNMLQQTGEVDRASGMVLALGAVALGFGIIFLIIALVVSI